MNGRFTEKDTVFFKALEEGKTVEVAAHLASYAKSSVYFFKKNHPDFKHRWELARAQYEQSLLDEMDRRAVKGVKKAVYYKGKVVGHHTEFSDYLLVKRLKFSNRKKYGENSIVDDNDELEDGAQIISPNDETNEAPLSRKVNIILNGVTLKEVPSDSTDD